MDNAIHFFDELKKGMQQVEQAIEDWDYQDFSPDKRRALLEEQITNDVADDREPEADAMQHIHAQQLDWSGLSPDDELTDYNCTSEAVPGSMSYEARVVLMSTPAGGIQGIPDADTLSRFLNKAHHAMDPQALTQALASRLQDSNCCWQTRSKVLVLIHALIESAALAPHYLPLFKQSGGGAQLLLLLEKLRTSDHNHVVRENARKALSLIHSNGANAMQIPREVSTVVKTHGTTLAYVRSKKATPSVSHRAVKSPPPAPLTSIKVDHLQRTKKANDGDHYLHTSPKIARAALASWRRRNSQEDAMANPNLLPFQSPPEMMKSGSDFAFMVNPSSSITTSNASRYQSGQLSAFAFIQ